MSITLSERVSAAVRAEAARRSMSIAALARLLGVEPMYLWRRLRGEVPWGLDDVEAVAVALETSEADLLRERAA